MASSSNHKSRSSASGKRRTSSAGNSQKRSTSARNAAQQQRDSALFREIGLIVLFVVMVLLFLCNFGVIGEAGDAVSGFLFGMFGFSAYIAPVFIFLCLAFSMANQGNPTAVRKLIAAVVLFLMFGVICDLVVSATGSMTFYDLGEIYNDCKANRHGGGVLAGSLTYLLQHHLETMGTVLVVILCAAVSFILLTERSILEGLRNGSQSLRERRERYEEEAEAAYDEAESDPGMSRAEARRAREEERERARANRAEERRLREEEKRIREEERRLREEEKENDRILHTRELRTEKKVIGVTPDTTLREPAETQTHREDVHEIRYREEPEETAEAYEELTAHQPQPEEIVLPKKEPAEAAPAAGAALLTHEAENIRVHKEDIPEPEELQPVRQTDTRPKAAVPETEGMSQAEAQVHKEIKKAENKTPKKYIFPPLSRLQKGPGLSGESARELRETAMRLQQTLKTFGVNVTVTDISQGPTVTRYELQPDQGVKVSKIVGLADDIKLNLAATDIRIEAPIPGKAAVGIEVPNKEKMTVALRDLLESKEFKEFPSNVAFAVGKDIAGKTVVADIAKMPHMLIAGSTGSGKSVCINTLIMSILYKSHPDDVKLIMVDPKVVELSVYNGIPHLLIPVVTDPKKAAAALHWAVSEMEDRYRKFADYNVRDLKGYNKQLEAMRENGEADVPAKMPQIVIIVDELADLMMVSPGEVEESICRLAQLARACGIHLIIATQRPSVDVITGLIKANMPSRVAFRVSSGIDSRTILDMVGAEKLLGNGDMLFYPQGYSKPARIQGAFVSDKEVSSVVDFLKNQMIGNVYAEEVEEQIRNLGSASGGTSGSSAAGGGADNGRDEYFAEAGRFIIEKDKASIGMLQRLLKIGFNRAARIMDQLCEYGVVGEEEGTKPRKVLMTQEQFEQLLEEL